MATNTPKYGISKKEQLIKVAIINRYVENQYGYKKITENNTHWLTIFDEGEFQMYAYETNDSKLDDIYNTGVLDNASEIELQVLIRVLVDNHK